MKSTNTSSNFHFERFFLACFVFYVYFFTLEYDPISYLLLGVEWHLFQLFFSLW